MPGLVFLRNLSNGKCTPDEIAKECEEFFDSVELNWRELIKVISETKFSSVHIGVITFLKSLITTKNSKRVIEKLAESLDILLFKYLPMTPSGKKAVKQCDRQFCELLHLVFSSVKDDMSIKGFVRGRIKSLEVSLISDITTVDDINLAHAKRLYQDVRQDEISQEYDRKKKLDESTIKFNHLIDKAPNLVDEANVALSKVESCFQLLNINELQPTKEEEASADLAGDGPSSLKDHRLHGLIGINNTINITLPINSDGQLKIPVNIDRDNRDVYLNLIDTIKEMNRSHYNHLKETLASLCEISQNYPHLRDQQWEMELNRTVERMKKAVNFFYDQLHFEGLTDTNSDEEESDEESFEEVVEDVKETKVNPEVTSKKFLKVGDKDDKPEPKESIILTEQISKDKNRCEILNSLHNFWSNNDTRERPEIVEIQSVIEFGEEKSDVVNPVSNDFIVSGGTEKEDEDIDELVEEKKILFCWAPLLEDKLCQSRGINGKCVAHGTIVKRDSTTGKPIDFRDVEMLQKEFELKTKKELKRKKSGEKIRKEIIRKISRMNK